MVENPIDVIKIQQKLKTDEYANMDELKVGRIFLKLIFVLHISSPRPTLS